MAQAVYTWGESFVKNSLLLLLSQFLKVPNIYPWNLSPAKQTTVVDIAFFQRIFGFLQTIYSYTCTRNKTILVKFNLLKWSPIMIDHAGNVLKMNNTPTNLHFLIYKSSLKTADITVALTWGDLQLVSLFTGSNGCRCVDFGNDRFDSDAYTAALFWLRRVLFVLTCSQTSTSFPSSKLLPLFTA